MAVKEGLCSNCGSLMRIDDSKETATCIFCWAEVNANEALDLIEDSEGHEFLNETFDEPGLEEKTQALAAQGFGGIHVSTSARQVPKKTIERKEGKLTPREKVALQNKPLVKPYCSKKHLLLITAGVVGFVAVIAAIAFPMYFTREGKKKEIKEKLPNSISFASDQTLYNINKQNNSAITIISPEAIDEATAKDIFEKYASIYSETYGISAEDAKAKIQVKILDEENGGYAVSLKENEVVSNDLD